MANTIKLSAEEIELVKEDNARAFQEAKKAEDGSAASGEATKGIADRGKEWLMGGPGKTG